MVVVVCCVSRPNHPNLSPRFRCFALEHVGKTGVSMRFLSRHGFSVLAPINERLAAQRRPPRGSGRPRTGMTEHTVKSLRVGARQGLSSGQPDLPTLKTLLITGSCSQVSLFGLFTFCFNSQVTAPSHSIVQWVSRFRLSMFTCTQRGPERHREAQKGTQKGAKRHRGPHRGTERQRHAWRGTERHREAEKGTERHREAQRGTERHREAQRGTERHREAQRGTEKHGKAQGGIERHREAVNTLQRTTINIARDAHNQRLARQVHANGAVEPLQCLK